MSEKLTAKQFFNKVLNGTALGIIIGLIPNAVLSGILNLLGDGSVVTAISHAALIFQMATPLLIGALIALQFGLNPMRVMLVAGSAMVGSGVVRFNSDLGVFVGAGAGDIINTMITASVAVLLIMLIGEKLGSVNIVFGPILIGVGAGFIGIFTLPYVAFITTAIGHGINTFTNLQPILMSILISVSFAFIILSPLSTVAIGMAIQLNGISAGAAAMGVAAAAIVLVVNSWKVNKSGVTIAVALGAMKMFMPNLFRYPIILVPTFFTAAIAAIPVALFSISGVPTSAGFGLVGLVGPLASLEAGLSIPLAILSWLIVPVIAALVAQLIFEKTLKLYNKEEVFAFLQDEPKSSVATKKAA